MLDANDSRLHQVTRHYTVSIYLSQRISFREDHIVYSRTMRHGKEGSQCSVSSYLKVMPLFQANKCQVAVKKVKESFIVKEEMFRVLWSTAEASFGVVRILYLVPLRRM